jgi:hemoglobin-like flavoprotein
MDYKRSSIEEFAHIAECLLGDMREFRGDRAAAERAIAWDAQLAFSSK